MLLALALADPTPFESCCHSERVRDELTGWGAEVEAHVEGDEPPAFPLGSLDEGGYVTGASAEPVDLRDDDPARMASVYGLERGTEPVALSHARAGATSILVPADDCDPVPGGVLRRSRWRCGIEALWVSRETRSALRAGGLD